MVRIARFRLASRSRAVGAPAPRHFPSGKPVRSKNGRSLKKSRTSSPAAMPMARQASSRMTARGAPSARLKTKRLGLIRTELAMKAASRCCGTPFRARDAIRGTVPYMQMGEAAPRPAASAVFGNPNPPSPIREAAWAMRGERNTWTRDPTATPAIQYGTILQNCRTMS